jgi:hypothetical protein
VVGAFRIFILKPGLHPLECTSGGSFCNYSNQSDVRKEVVENGDVAAELMVYPAHAEITGERGLGTTMSP